MTDLISVVVPIAREFGFPVVTLAVIVFCLREAAAALHRSVVVPVVDSHTRFVASTTETLTSLARTQEQQAATLEEIATGQRDIQRVLGKGG